MLPMVLVLDGATGGFRQGRRFRRKYSISDDGGAAASLAGFFGANQDIAYAASTVEG